MEWWVNAALVGFLCRDLKSAKHIFPCDLQKESEPVCFLRVLALTHGCVAMQVEDKVIKNHFASEFIYNKYKNMKTCGVIEEDRVMGYTKWVITASRKVAGHS